MIDQFILNFSAINNFINTLIFSISSLVIEFKYSLIMKEKYLCFSTQEEF